MKAATHRQEIPPIVLAISIHAAREGGDPHSEGFKLNVFISIHAAREGGDGYGYSRRCNIVISIHAAREGGDVGGIAVVGGVAISIHAAREGGDAARAHSAHAGRPFQSTPPVKAATLCSGFGCR